MSARLIILGLDGASWRLTQKLIAMGRMPNLARWVTEGSAGPLYSTIPAVSPTAWASFMTGKNPGQHGIYGFTQKIPATYRLCPSGINGKPAATLWGLLSARGRRVAVVNVPMTYPAEPVNGLLIAGLGSPDAADRRFTYPPRLLEELRHYLGPYILDVDWVDYESRGPEAMLDAVREMTRRRADYGLHILGREAWDLFVLVFVSTDRIQHCLWQYLDPTDPLSPAQRRVQKLVLDYYTYLDQALGEFLARAPEANVLVISDHGFGPLAKFVHLNTWLSEEGFLTWETWTKSWRNELVRLARRLGVTPQRLTNLLKRSRLGAQRKWSPASLQVRQICWSRTRAFCYAFKGIYLNLKGREPEGIVEPGAEAEQLYEQIQQRLLNLRDPETGERIIQRLARPHELYHGVKLDLAPDLIIAEADPRYSIVFNQAPTRQVFERSDSAWRTGEHDPEGLLVAWGPSIARGRRPERAELVDLCPTALALLGEPIPGDMDGRVLSELLPNGGQVVTAPVATEACSSEADEVLTPEEQQKVFERLRGLGYIE